MSHTEQLPLHLGGYQQLDPSACACPDDIFVFGGIPISYVGREVGGSVYEIGKRTGYRVYRKIPCLRQGGERPTTVAEAEHQMAVDAGKRLGGPLCPQGLPTDAKARKGIPIATGCLDYFPDALAAVAELSRIGNEQHNPGKPLHWDRSKSGDEADALMRHLLQRDEVDSDGVLHAVKVAWRGLALAQKKIESLRKV